MYLITYKNLIFFKNQMSQKISSGFYMLSCTIFSSVTDRQYLYVALFLLLQKLFLVDIHMWVDVPFILNSIYFVCQAAQVSGKLFKGCTLRQDSDLHPLCSRNHCLIQCISYKDLHNQARCYLISQCLPDQTMVSSAKGAHFL